MSYIEEDLQDNIVIDAKPFLKWAGGKKQLIGDIKNKFPKDILSSKYIKKYFEPFIGGGGIIF